MFRATPYVALFVERFPEALEFYRDVLELKLLRQGPAAAEFSWNGMILYVEKGKGLKPGYGNFHFEFETPDFAVACGILLQYGCEIMERYQEKSVLVADPFGMCFHLYEEGVMLPGAEA